MSTIALVAAPAQLAVAGIVVAPITYSSRVSPIALVAAAAHLAVAGIVVAPIT